MEFYNVLDSRRSIRSFKDKAIHDDKLNRILEAVMSAPTAGNLQSYRVLVVRDRATKEALCKAAWDQKFVMEAPVVLVFSTLSWISESKYAHRGRELYTIQDATIATTYAHLAAVAEGLGSCWVGAFDPDQVSAAVDLPKDQTAVALLPIGHPKKVPGRTSRIPMKDMVTFQKV